MTMASLPGRPATVSRSVRSVLIRPSGAAILAASLSPDNCLARNTADPIHYGFMDTYATLPARLESC